MATTRASQSPVVYGWGDCLNNKLANGIVSAENKEKASSSLVDSMLSPLPPTWARPKKVVPLTTSSLSKSAEVVADEEEENKSSGPIIIHGVACGAHNSAFIAVGGAYGDYGAVLVSGAGLSQHGTSLLCDHPSGTGEKDEKDGRMPHSPLSAPIVLPRPGPLATQTVTQVSLGNYHAALVTRTGQAYTWGWGSLGQLGHGDGNSKSEPTHVLSIYAVHQIECGTKFTAAVTLFGELYVFGENEQGQLGLGNTQRQLSPVQCKRLSPFTVTHIACGAAHMTAVSTDSLDRATSTPGFSAMHAGSSSFLPFDALTTGTSSSSALGDDKNGDPSWMQLASFNPSTAARPCAGVATRVWTWGQASTSGKVETLPREVVSMRGLGITQVACGEMHSLALSSLGQVFEWKVGEVPVHVGGALQGHIVRAIDCGAYHSLALTANGNLFSWGRSKTGQLGRPDSGDMTKPGLVSFEKKIKDHKDDAEGGTGSKKLARAATASSTTTPISLPPKANTTPTNSPSKPAGAPPKLPTPVSPARSASPTKEKSSRNVNSVTGSTAPSHPFVARVSAGEYHNIAIIERDPRRLLLWKILKKEREYLVRLHIIVDMYMAILMRMNEEEASSPLAETAATTDWQRLLGEWSVVGTPHAITTANSSSNALYKQYHIVAASATQLQATGDPMGSVRGDRSSTSSPRHRSTSSQQLTSPGSPISHSTSQAALDTTSPRSAGAKSTTASSASLETFRQFVGEADIEHVLHTVFGNIASIYRVHSQFVQELGKVIEDSHGLGSDAGAAVDAVLTLWRFRLSFFSLYAFYADQYSVGAYHLFVLAKSFPHFNAALKAVQDLANSRFAKPGSAPPDFSLKHLLLEPLRHVALETQLLRQLQDSCIAPTKLRKSLQSITGDDGPKQRPTHKAPIPPNLSGAPPLSRRPSLPTRPAPPAEALPSALSHSQFAWHAPYLYSASSVVSLDETLAHMSGLLERVCKNFNFVDATEILTATMDERGFPQISGGSVELLVKRLTHHSFTDNEFVNAFLLTYRMFITPIQFLNLLVQRYHNTYPPGLDEREKDAYSKLVRFPIQSRVVQVLLQWVQSPLSNYDWQPKIPGTDVDENQKALHAALNQFCTSVLLNDPEWKPHALLIQGLLKSAAPTQKKVIMVGPAATSDSIASQAPSPSTMLASPVSPTTLALVADISSVLHFENSVKTMASTIAQQDFSVLREVSAKDFLNKSWTRENFSTLAPGLHTLTMRFNGLASWACYEVVNHENVKDRTSIIGLFAQLAANLLELRDYNAFVAIMSGLNNSSATRLKKSHSKLSTKQAQQLEHLSDLASGKENYRILRQLWAIAQPPATPFLALTLKDLTFIEDGNPDKLEDGSTNFYKYRKMAEVISLCLSTRDVISTSKPDTIFDAYLKKTIPIAVDLGDDGIYKLSKKRE